MARTVADAATLLGVLAGRDERDPATGQIPAGTPTDYTKFLDRTPCAARVSASCGRTSASTTRSTAS
jgi:Asp-tRNA(Asn)/Glu-tRNA(Gln) amidotransferase A subunit family amidase